MFKEYDPLTSDQLQIMNEKGEIINKKWMPGLSDGDIAESMKKMLYARTADLQAVSYQRQGRMHTYPPNLGQEAIATAAGMVMSNEDWLVGAYRELAAWLAKGVTLEEVFLYWNGHEDGSRRSNAKRTLPVSVPISSQLLHAVGIGYSLKLKKEKAAVFTFCGDGGTSQGDFHEALNFAAVWKVPVIFIVQNNGYAISYPVSKQTVSRNIAVKSVAYGMPGIQVDGNDILASYSAFQYSKDYVLEGNGPVLIEAVTYRMGAHTTSDDPGRYRSKEEEDSWTERDPVERVRKYLEGKGLWDKKTEDKLLAQYRDMVDTEFRKVENYKPYELTECFDYMYADPPGDLNRQKVDYEKFLNRSEGSK